MLGPDYYMYIAHRLYMFIYVNGLCLHICLAVQLFTHFNCNVRICWKRFIFTIYLAAMTYKQVQSFQIKDYANYYVDIEITRYRALYSKSTAGRGIARFIS